MKAFNKSILILFMSLIVLSLALTSVSAEDVNDISTTSISNYDSVSEDIVSVGESEVKSFEDLQKLIDENTNGTIDLDCDYRYMGITNGVFTDKNITINGNGHTLDGANQSRIFHLSGANVYVYNINFINANASSSKWSTSGGAVYGHNGNFTIANCNFTNNYGSSGGALGTASWLSSNFTVINCNFINNSASSGGAVYARSIDLINSSFINNYVTGIGGAVSATNMDVSSSYFINNSASNNGGAIYGTSIGVSSSYFINNSASNNGGAINSRSTKITKCTFINNSASAGGAIFNSVHNLNVFNSEFINNSASRGGDIASFDLPEVSYSTHIYLRHSTFTNSYASDMGGCVYTIGGVSAINSTFVNNSAPNMGGSICHYGLGKYAKRFEFNNSTFINCNSSTGGAVFLYGMSKVNPTFKNSKFINNSARGGGAIYTLYPSLVDFCTFLSNSANNTGGAISLGGSGSVVQYSIFDNNSASNGRAVIFSGSGEFNNNYWSMNFTSVDEFINANLVAGKTSAMAPDNWVLMNIYVDPVLEVGTNSSVAVKFDKISDGSTISDFDGVLPDYSTNLYMLTMKEDEEYNHKWGKENHNISRTMDTLVLHKNEAKYDFVVDAPGLYCFYTHSPLTIWEESAICGVAALQPNMTVQVITLNPLVYVGNTTSFEVVVKNNGEYKLSSVCIDESSFDDLIFDSWSSEDAWIYSFEDGVHKWTLNDILDVNETTSFVLVFNTTNVGNKTISVVGSSVNENISDKVADNVTEVIKINTIVTVDPVKGEVGDIVNITAKVTDQEGNPVPNGTVIIEFNGEEYTADVVDGIATVEVILPNAGNYSATAYYKESDKYYGSNTVFAVEVTEVPGPNPNPDPNPKPTPINNGNMENCGNPLLVLLIALGMIGIESLRRKF